MTWLRLFVSFLIAAAALPQDAVIEIHADRKAQYKIPRTIYGTFLEPIGNSIYGGLWAQVLENPSFEENLWSLNAIQRKAEANPALHRASTLGLPLPWEPLDERQGARYEPRWNDAANSYRSLLLMALPAAETGIRQQVYLPVHRTRQYKGSLYARHVSGPSTVKVSLRKRNRADLVLATAEFDAPAREWTRHEFALELKPRDLAALEPADFAIAVTGSARVLLDQVLLWPADHASGMDPEMIEMSRALRTPVIRFGGNYTSAYHWRDGIGPLDKRVSMLNLAWGMPEYNHFGTDEFLEFCKLVGAEPQIALNLGTGTPEEAADWVRYVNQRWGRGGLLWELGNELWGDFQTGYPTLAGIAALTKAYSDAVRAVDKDARLIATGQDPDHFEEWNRAQLTNPPGTFQLLATHFVVGDARVVRRQAPADHIALSTFAMPVELERRLRSMKKQIDDHPQWRGKADLAFTEWLFHGPDDRTPRFHNMGGAIAAAGMLNALIRTAGFVPVSNMTGLIEFGGIWKKRGRTYGVPAYWAFRMYSTADAARPVEIRAQTENYDIAEGNERLQSIPAVPYLDVTAALNERGDKLTVFVISRHLHRGVEARIALDGFVPVPEVHLQTLSAGSIYDANSEQRPEAVVPISSTLRVTGSELTYRFPRSSLTRLEFTAR